MIRGTKGSLANNLMAGKSGRRLPGDVVRAAERKMAILDAAASLDDLAIPPGNRLENLSGDRKCQHSIRINRRWRICFRWDGADAHDVEIVDYHR